MRLKSSFHKWLLKNNTRHRKFLHFSSSSRAFSTKTREIEPAQTFLTNPEDLKPEYDVVVIGAGHNGLVAAAYLRKAGFSVCVLEKRPLVGGAAVTEEIIPGFKFSRASYVLSLLRPFIISDLKLKDYGLKFYMREPYSSFSPIRVTAWDKFPSKYLLMSSDLQRTCKEIAKFSQTDAKAYPLYEEQMSKFVQAINLLLDNRPPNFHHNSPSSKFSKLSQNFQSLTLLAQIGRTIGLGEVASFHQTLTSSAAKILNKWFESEPLKATLATDALIGNMAGPHSAGTGYVLLHHLMGGVEGKSGAWAYAEGGMGAVSNAIASSAAALGAHIFINKEVSQILYNLNSSQDSCSVTRAVGVLTKEGEQIRAKAVFSSCTPEVTFKKLFPSSIQVREELFGSEFVRDVDQIDYASPVTKINVAVSRLPDFLAKPNKRVTSSSEDQVQDLHKCTIHMASETMDDLDASYRCAGALNRPSERPMIEMVIPSSLDPTIAPKGGHVCLIFSQFTPIHPCDGSWADLEYKDKYKDRVFDIIDKEYCPGFKDSVIGADVLTPLDLQEIFSLTGGNIFHGSMGLDQLFWLRPVFTRKSWFPETPLKSLYLCGSGAHPGGGILGLPGFFAAKTFIDSP